MTCNRTRICLVGFALIGVHMGCQPTPDPAGGADSPSWPGANVARSAASDHVTDTPVRLGPIDTLGDTTSWGLPSHMELVGDFLLVVDPYADNQVVVVDPGSGHIFGSFARKGGGPSEVDQLALIYAESHAPPHVWLYDLRTTRFSLWALDHGIPKEPVRSFRLELEGIVPQPFLTDYGMIYTAKYSDVVLYLADSSGSIRQKVGTAPYPTTDHIYDAGVNQGVPVTDPERRRIALGYLHTNRVDFFKVTGVHIATSRAPGDIPEPRVKLVDGQRRLERPLPRTYGGGAATSRFVYYLFCSDCDTRASATRRYVQVFDWTGQFIMTLDLGATTWAIEVTPDDDVLYAATVDPYPLIIAYRLPSTLQASGSR